MPGPGPRARAMRPAMGRIAIPAFGALVLSLAASPATGQERPRVQVRKLEVEQALARAASPATMSEAGRRELQFKANMGNAANLISREEFQKQMVIALQTNQTFQARVRFLNREGEQDRGEKTILVSPDGHGIMMSSSHQPLMRGELRLAVEELEEAHDQLEAGSEKSLLALNLVEKAVMKTRRALAAQEDEAEVFEPTTDEPWLVFVSTAGSVDQTPIQRERGYLRHTVTSVRYALDLDEARWTLDEVEKSAATLRALLWEKASGRD